MRFISQPAGLWRSDGFYRLWGPLAPGRFARNSREAGEAVLARATGKPRGYKSKA